MSLSGCRPTYWANTVEPELRGGNCSVWTKITKHSSLKLKTDKVTVPPVNQTFSHFFYFEGSRRVVILCSDLKT